jgi:DNA-binding protein WhiA
MVWNYKTGEPMKRFSTALRAELARVKAEGCCAWAELSGILRSSGSLHLQGMQRVSVSVKTEHADVARKVVTLLRIVAGLPVGVLVEEHEQSPRRRVYHVQTDTGSGVARFLETMGILSHDGEIVAELPGVILAKECCQIAFLRGAYMMHGSVSDPRGQTYHLEIVVGREDFGLGLYYLFNLLHFKAHLAERKGRHVLYLKDADNIARFLTLIKAHAARIEFEEVRVVKELRGGVNRLVNAETANVGKTAAASVEQIHLIQALKDGGVMEKLPFALRQLAAVRLAHPEASLAELGLILPKPISKSAVNHRLRRLRKYVEEI